jgi:hypothetical protein
VSASSAPKALFTEILAFGLRLKLTSYSLMFLSLLKVKVNFLPHSVGSHWVCDSFILPIMPDLIQMANSRRQETEEPGEAQSARRVEDGSP